MVSGKKNNQKIEALKRPFPSIFGAPIIERVDCSIFLKKYFAPCMENTSCQDCCCAYGVDVDLENLQRIMKYADPLEKLLGIPREKWFRPGFKKDPEFPGGKFTRTQVFEGACTFLNRKGRGCLIHSYCLNNGIDFHILKPMVGVLFPVTFDYGLLQPSTEIQDKSLACYNSGEKTLYRGVREDLQYYFGEGFIEELDNLERFC